LIPPGRTPEVCVNEKTHEEQVKIPLSLSEEKISIERIAVNKIIKEAAPAVRYSGDTMIISVMKEEVVVQKRLVLVEELHIRRHVTEKKTTETHTVHKEEVIVERDVENSEDNILDNTHNNKQNGS
jgi:stress response protein YsnF